MNRRLTLLFVFAGLALRVGHYLRCPSVWHDEAALIVNVIGKDYRELLGSLLHHEAGPPLFLWIEHFFAETFGDSVWSLRFPALAASCIALIAFWDLCRRTLEDRAVPWAVLLFAVSDRLLWHASEAKPYAFDVLVAVLLALGFARTRPWSIPAQCLLWLPILPVCIWLSYPACFLGGGIVVGLLVRTDWRAVRRKLAVEEDSAIHGGLMPRRSPWLDSFCMFTLVAVVGIAFLLLAVGPAKAQRDGAMESCWTNHFPDWSRPWMFPVWSLFSSLDLLRYNLIPFGQLLAGLVGVGAAIGWRRRQFDRLAVLLVPAALAFAASCLNKYPYGGSRLEIFLAPALILLIAAAVPAAFDWLRERLPRGRAVMTGLLLLPALQTAYRVAIDWPRADCAGAAGYVLAHRAPGEALLVRGWEFEYYFRTLDSLTVRLHDREIEERPSEAWIVATGDQPEEREKFFQPLLAGARILERREFFRVTAVRVRYPEQLVQRP